MSKRTDAAVHRIRHSAQEATDELTSVAKKHARSIAHETAQTAQSEALHFAGKKATGALYRVFALVAFGAALLAYFADSDLTLRVLIFSGLGLLLWFHERISY